MGRDRHDDDSVRVGQLVEDPPGVDLEEEAARVPAVGWRDELAHAVGFRVLRELVERLPQRQRPAVLAEQDLLSLESYLERTRGRISDQLLVRPASMSARP